MNTDSIRIRTGTRLHLGLLSLPGGDNSEEPRRRSFGGAGLMIDGPVVQIEVATADKWSAEGPSRERALEAAQRAALAIPEARRRPLRVRIEQCPHEHIGLGVGTQLAMAVAMAVRSRLGEPSDPRALAADLGRGLRSGLGVHGFAAGGFLVDGGKGPNTKVAPLVCRHAFPSEWRILLATPCGQHGLAGADERAAFVQLAREGASAVDSEALCRLVVLGLVPALLERDLAAFGEACFEFNRRAGLLFKASQGGEYHSAEAAALVAALRQFGVRGVGQSSWGPTIFAIDDVDRLTAAMRRLKERFSAEALDVRMTSARNRGWEYGAPGA